MPVKSKTRQNKTNTILFYSDEEEIDPRLTETDAGSVRRSQIERQSDMKSHDLKRMTSLPSSSSSPVCFFVSPTTHSTRNKRRPSESISKSKPSTSTGTEPNSPYGTRPAKSVSEH